jgi:hypothetical protein
MWVLIELRDQAFSIGTSCDFLRDARGENRAAMEALRELLWGKVLRSVAGDRTRGRAQRKLSASRGK